MGAFRQGREMARVVDTDGEARVPSNTEAATMPATQFLSKFDSTTRAQGRERSDVDRNKEGKSLSATQFT